MKTQKQNLPYASELKKLPRMNMGNRLSSIVTRTGDDGSTGLGDGKRTTKNSLRIHAIGDVDELNSLLGLLRCESMSASLQNELLTIQHGLFDLGGELSIPGHVMLNASHVANLDVLLKKYNADLPPLKEFILPGGSRAAATAHVCRSVCRRAERSLVDLGKEEKISELARQYLNRLSDLLFVLAREFNRQSGSGDVFWQRDK